MKIHTQRKRIFFPNHVGSIASSKTFGIQKEHERKKKEKKRCNYYK